MNNKLITQQELEAAWIKLADEYERNHPFAVRFVSTLRNAKPRISEDNNRIVFSVGFYPQQEWIKKHAAEEMLSFLRKELSNNELELVIDVENRVKLK